MKRYLLLIAVWMVPWGLARAQDPVYPLPADLYILTSDQHVVRVDAVTVGQTIISPFEQPVIDFDIAPDGEWYVYRTANQNMVIVAEITGRSGYVLEFDAAPPPDVSSGQTLAWSPDVAALAYLVPDGVRIAALGLGEYGQPVFTTLAGGPWTALAWTGPDALLVQDAAGSAARITRAGTDWALYALPDPPQWPDPAIPAALTPEGVVLDDGARVPGTAGALAFDWGPVPPPVVTGAALPADLYVVAPDASGIDQVRVLPQNGDLARPVTAESAPVTAFDVAAASNRIAYTTAERLIVARLDGSEREELLTVSEGASFAWNADGTRLIAINPSTGGQQVPTIFRFDVQTTLPPQLLPLEQSGDPETDPFSVRVLFDPRWSPDGTRLLFGIGYYEGSGLGVVDPATGGVTELMSISGSAGMWTADGRVITWAADRGYVVPGLYVIDPASPDAQPQTILDERYAVLDVVQQAADDWFVLIGSVPGMGPQFLRVLTADSLAGPFEPVAGDLVGGFADSPQLTVQGDAIMVAGLRGATYDETGRVSGDLVLVDMRSGETVQVDTAGPVHSVQWE